MSGAQDFRPGNRHGLLLYDFVNGDVVECSMLRNGPGHHADGEDREKAGATQAFSCWRRNESVNGCPRT